MIVLYGPRLYDYYAAAQYTPSTRVKEMSGKLALTEEGRRLLYASHPQIETDKEFNKDCQSTERTAAMLGCYYKRKIFIYDVQHAELEGAVEVTTAHEMLHAAYDRLNIFERTEVDAMLRQAYETVKDEPDIKALMEYYRKAQPGTDINELHSIIGATVSSVTPELEKYYARYFDDRATVVAMNTRYTAVFKQVEQRAEELSRQLKTEESSLSTDLSSYESDHMQLQTDIESFNQRASSGGFTSRQAFELARSSLTTRVSTLEARRSDINARIASYNSRVEELNALSVRAKELNQSINGVAEPTSGL